MLSCIILQPSTAEYLFLTHTAISDQKNRRTWIHILLPSKTWCKKKKKKKKSALNEANVYRGTAQDWEYTVCGELTAKISRCLCSSFLYFQWFQTMKVLREKWYFLDRCWWIRFDAMWRCHYVAPPQTEPWRLCAALPSHTLWQELDQRDVYDKNIFQCVRYCYLTCSCGPPAEKKAQKKCLTIRRGKNDFHSSWRCNGLLMIPVFFFSPCKCHIIKLTFTCPHGSFKLTVMQFWSLPWEQTLPKWQKKFWHACCL